MSAPNTSELTDRELYLVAIEACDELNITRLHALGWPTVTSINDAELLDICRTIQRAVFAMLRQGGEPLFWYRPRSDGRYEGPIPQGRIEEVRKTSGSWVPLYAVPHLCRDAAQRAPGSYVNVAGIAASDAPGTVVTKLDAAFHRAPSGRRSIGGIAPAQPKPAGSPTMAERAYGKGVLGGKSQAASTDVPSCSCPSGNGSLQHPCPQHPTHPGYAMESRDG